MHLEGSRAPWLASAPQGRHSRRPFTADGRDPPLRPGRQEGDQSLPGLHAAHVRVDNRDQALAPRTHCSKKKTTASLPLEPAEASAAAKGAGAGAGATASVARVRFVAAATEPATNVPLLRMRPGSNSWSAWIHHKAERLDQRPEASCASTRRKTPLSSAFCCRSRDPLRISGGDWHPHEGPRVAAQWPRAAGRRPRRSSARRASGPSCLWNPPSRTAPAFALANAALCKFVCVTGGNTGH
eukprot:scaffold35422_cov57-Phaeocystis_antarctica.AAC.1